MQEFTNMVMDDFTRSRVLAVAGRFTRVRNDGTWYLDNVDHARVACTAAYDAHSRKRYTCEYVDGGEIPPDLRAVYAMYYADEQGYERRRAERRVMSGIRGRFAHV